MDTGHSAIGAASKVGEADREVPAPADGELDGGTAATTAECATQGVPIVDAVEPS